MRIGDLLEHQSVRPILIKPNNTIGDASRLMAEFRIGILIVVDEAQDIVGVLSERDIATAIGRTEENLAQVMVGNLMTRKVVTCDPDESVVDAVYVMNKAKFRHLILARANKPLGVLSMRDVLRQIEPLLEESKNKGDEQKLMAFLGALKAA